MARLPSWPQYWRLTPTAWQQRCQAALLHQRGVIDHENRVRPADQPVGSLHQRVFQRCGEPGRGRDEVMQLLGITRCYPRRHGLDALALAGQDQAFEVDRRPMPLRLAPQPLQKRFQPAIKVVLPAVSR